jgi:excisionase family DNA binding protein
MSSNIEITRICQFCSNSFTAKTTVTKYCSHRCASRAYKARQRGEDIVKSNQETEATISAPIVELQAKDFLSVSDASTLLGVSRWTLSRAINDGRLNIVRFGKRIVIKRTEIDRLFS